MGHGRARSGVVLALALGLGFVASRPASACRPYSGDLIRERIGRGATIASVRADPPAERPTKARAGQRTFGGAAHHPPPPVAQRPGSSSDKFEAQRNGVRRVRDALPMVASGRRGSTRVSRNSTATEDLLTTAPSAVFYEANAPPARSFGVAGS